MTHEMGREGCSSAMGYHENRAIDVWNLGPRCPAAFSLRDGVPSDLLRRINDILLPYRRTGEDLLRLIDQDLIRQNLQFWTLVLFDRELPLADHFKRERRDASLYKGLMYVQKRERREIDYFPGLGGVLLCDKEVALPVNPDDQLMNRIWESVKSLDPSNCWCVIVTTPEELWIQDLAQKTNLSDSSRWHGWRYNAKYDWSTDPGLEALAHLYGTSLNIDDTWSPSREREFLWWPHDCKQIVKCFPEIEDKGAEVFRLLVASDLVLGAEARPDEVLDAIARLMPKLSGSSAPYYDATDGSIQLISTGWVHTGNVDWLKRDFGAFAALQIADAEEFAESFSKQVSGIPDWTRHPISGSRLLPDEMLSAKDKMFKVPLGWINNWFMPPVLLPVIDFLKMNEIQTGWLKEGFFAEIPYREESISFLTVTCIPHPELGEGCRLTLTLPVCAARSTILRAANRMNLLELKGDSRTPLVGYWTASDVPDQEGSKLVFISFLPNHLYGNGKLLNYVLYMVGRARWAASLDNPLAGKPCEHPMKRHPPAMMKVKDIKRIFQACGIKIISPDDPRLKGNSPCILSSVSPDFGLQNGIFTKRDEDVI